MQVPTLRLLLAEDNPDDAALELRALERGGRKIVNRVVDSKAAFESALRDFAPDVILSDFSMPGFDGMEALKLAVELARDVPFIFVSGTLGEDHAVLALKNGATDYVLKTNLIRLSPAVERALAEAQIRRDRSRTELELEIARERLQEREAGLTRAQHMAKLAHVITGTDGSFKAWSDTLPKLIDLEESQIPRTTHDWLGLVHPEDRDAFRRASVYAAATGRHTQIDYRLVHHNGSVIHVRQVMEPLEVHAKADRRWFNTLQDVSEHKLAQVRIKRLNRVHAVLSGINGLIVRASQREQLFQGACRIAVDDGQLAMAWLGVVDRAANAVRPVAWAGLVGDFLRIAADRLSLGQSGPSTSPVVLAVRERQPFVVNDVVNDERILLKKEHAERGIRSMAMLPLLVGEEPVGVLSLHAKEPGFFDDDEMKLLRELAGDIAFAVEHIEKEERLNYLAYYDSLTDLANRTLFLERLSQSMHAASEGGRKLALVIVDIERFKAINDSLGRQAGDELLRQVAGRMASMRDRVELARVGADQFAVMAPEVESDDGAARLVEKRARGLFGRPYNLMTTELRVGARAGIALFPNDGKDAETLFRNAESALKKAKATGARQLFYAEEMTARTAENLALENRLRRALENDEFVLHYQPKVDLQSQRMVGAEALIRWQSPELGLVPPGKFIPLMEETGLILDVGAWALRQVAREQRGWLERGLVAPRIAVNVSARQLQQKNFIDVLKSALREAGSPPAIDLEITESLLMQDIERNIETLRQAQSMGLAVAIDDFGTGHSSLAYLAKLPLDALKIDRSFIITMLSEADTMTLVQTIISLAHSLRLKVIAEGVETEEQARMLRLLRCDQMQGYLFSKPVPSEKFVALLSEEMKAYGHASTA